MARELTKDEQRNRDIDRYRKLLTHTKAALDELKKALRHCQGDFAKGEITEAIQTVHNKHQFFLDVLQSTEEG